MTGCLAATRGRGGPLFALPGGNSGDVSSGGTAATTVLAMNTAGTFSIAGGTSGVLESGNWVTPTIYAPGAYTIRAHLNSGTALTGSAMDVDLAISGNPSWSLTEAVVGTLTANVTLTLKDGGGNTLKTGTFNLTAQRLT